MKKTLILTLVSNRSESSVAVQECLTNHGCFIKTRLGLHEGTDNMCSESGLIVLEVTGDEGEKKKLHKNLNAISGVHAEIVNLEV